MASMPSEMGNGELFSKAESSPSPELRVEMRRRITAVLFTYSWCGYAIRTADGQTEQLSPEQLYQRVGQSQYVRLKHIAHANGMTGAWHPVPAK